jgi:hypothetical protein
MSNDLKKEITDACGRGGALQTSYVDRCLTTPNARMMHDAIHTPSRESSLS